MRQATQSAQLLIVLSSQPRNWHGVHEGTARTSVHAKGQRMTDELTSVLGDLGAVAVNAGELAQRIENNLERELKGKSRQIFVKL